MLKKAYRLPIQSVTNKKADKTTKSSYFSVKAFSNNLPYFRFGVVIGKKTAAKAVIRNKIRRIIFSQLEDLYKEKTKLISAKDILIIVFRPAANLSVKELKAQLLPLINKVI